MLKSLLASAGEGGSGGLDVKLFQEPLLPIAGSSTDLTPFVLMFILLTASSLFMRVKSGPPLVATIAQSLALGVWGLTVFLIGRALVDTHAVFTLDNILVVGTLGAFTASFVAVFWEIGGIRQSFRLAAQTCSFGAFVLSIHPCACMVRDALVGLAALNTDNLRAFEFLIVIVTVSAFTMAWGRAFCGWICPIGFVQELTTKFTSWSKRLTSKNAVVWTRWTACLIFLAALVADYVLRGPAELPFYQSVLIFWVVALLVLSLTVIADPSMEKRLWLIRYLSLALFAGTIALGMYLNGVFCVLLKNILAKPTVVLFVGVLFTTLVLSQAWCRFLCPEGALLGILTKLSGWKITLDKGKCTACNICKDVCPVEAIDIGKVVEPVCLYCCKCIDHCPTDALDMGKAPRFPLPLANLSA